MDTRYERNIFLFLSSYRFLAYGLAVVLIQVVSLDRGVALSREDYVLLSGIGVYTLFKVLAPLRWREEGAMTYVMLGGDFLVSLMAILLTGGLNSGFLLYALTPIMTASLLFHEVYAITLAAVTSASLALAHLLLYRWVDQYVWIMEDNNLLWLIVFVVSMFLMASTVYRTNLNIRRRIEMDAVIEERRRTRRELHDGVVQAMGYLNLKADVVNSLVIKQEIPKALEGLEEIRKTAQETYRSAREALDQLSIEIGVAELVPTLEEYVNSFAERSNIQVHFSAPDTPVRPSPLSQLQILRMAQEALSNVNKHAKATEVWVSLVMVSKKLVLMVKDNGLGIQLSEPAEDGVGHYGLDILRERAESLGGTLSIAGAPGEGTEVRVTVPGARGR